MRIRKLILCCCLCPLPAMAQSHAPTSMLLGPLGLNTIPSARMDESGTVRIGVSALDPYAHAYMGFQLAEPLYIQFRQSAEVSDINEAERMYPGVDLKLRLREETLKYPEVSLGIQSALGHKRMAGEYIVASKRWHDFDFTAGVGWGRYAGRWQMPNILKRLSGHFGGDRTIDGEMPAQPADWFTGENMGFFGGIEYFTPIDGLSVKADLGADGYRAEKAAFGFTDPPPWALGLSYKPFDWLDMGLAAHGTDKLMARLTLTPSLKNWEQKRKQNDLMLNPKRGDGASAAGIERDARASGIVLSGAQTGNRAASATLRLDPFRPAPEQYGEAAVIVANNGGRETEKIEITPTIMGLRGLAVKMLRKDFEKAFANKGSAEEIWQNTTFDAAPEQPFKKLRRVNETWLGLKDFRLVLDQHVSLSEEDTGILTRTSLIAGTRRPRLFGLIDTGAAFRLNLFNNLQDIDELRPPVFLPVRGNVDHFAQKILSLDEAYAAFSHSFTPEFHGIVTAGYLEEMYGGIGGELLYRPFGPRYAVGAELWQVFKREPASFLNMQFNGANVLTGHINAWYDVPDYNLTIGVKAGRYLEDDYGGTLSLAKTFEGGARLESFVTLTTHADYDVFGGTTHANSGIRLTLPLGAQKYLPHGTAVKFRAEPFGRNAGQILQSPTALYELTEPFSYGHMIQNWNGVTPGK